jgi:hypothetical protein
MGRLSNLPIFGQYCKQGKPYPAALQNLLLRISRMLQRFPIPQENLKISDLVSWMPLLFARKWYHLGERRASDILWRSLKRQSKIPVMNGEITKRFVAEQV